MTQLAGLAAIVTGGASGIGRASALLFAAEGARVTIADINAEDGEATAAEIRALGGEAIFTRTDMTRTDEIEAMVEAAVSAFGRLDILFHNAGIAGPGKLRSTTEAEYDLVMDIHLKAGFFASKYAAPHIVAAGGGAILFTASGLGLRPSRQSPAYSASKAGLLMLARALAVELADDGVRVNAICPGPIDSTPLWAGVLARNPGLEPEAYAEMNRQVRPIKRLGTPEEMARAALFMVSPASSYITGVALPVDGGGAMS